MAFDPDAYLADKAAPAATAVSAPAFDPDKYLAAKTAPADEEKPGILSRIGSGIADAAKSFNRGVNTIVGEVLPVDVVGPDGIHAPRGGHVPLSGLMEGSKRREFERGVSDVATFGAAEKIANSVSPELAASAEQDAKSAPGYRDAGGVGGMAVRGLPDLTGEAASAGAKGALKKIAGMADSATIKNRATDVIAGAGGTATKGERKALLNAEEPVKQVLASPAGEQIAKEAYADPATAAKTAEDWIAKTNVTRAADHDMIDRYTHGWSPQAAYDFVIAKKNALVGAGNVEKKRALQALADDVESSYGIADNTAPVKASAPVAKEIDPHVRDAARSSLDDILRERSGLPKKQQAVTPSQLVREAVPEAVGSEETKQLTTPNFTPNVGGVSGDPNAGYSPLGGEHSPTSENATVRIDTEQKTQLAGENQPTAELRDFATRLIKKTGDVEKDNAAKLQLDTVREFMNKHLDDATKIDPKAKEAVERVRSAYQNTMALYKIKEALQSRAVNKAIAVAKGAGLGATIGAVEGVANGHDGAESIEHALKGAAAGALLHKGVPAARRLVRNGAASAGGLAGRIPVPSGANLSRIAALSQIGGDGK